MEEKRGRMRRNIRGSRFKILGILILLFALFLVFRTMNHTTITQVSVSSWHASLEPESEAKDPDIHRLSFDAVIKITVIIMLNYYQ